MKKSKNQKLIFAILIVFLLSGGAYYFYHQNQVKIELAKADEEKNKDTSKDDIEKIKKVIEIPDETPTIMTISDIDKLKDNPFFAKATNDDRVYVFEKSSKALLYRPSNEKIIEFQTITLTKDASSTADTTKSNSQPKVAGTATTNVKISIQNGTTTAGLASKTESTLKTNFPKITFDILQKGNAVKKDYTKGIVVDMTKQNSEATSVIAKLLNANVAPSLPEGEKVPEGTQIAIIVTE